MDELREEVGIQKCFIGEESDEVGRTCRTN